MTLSEKIHIWSLTAAALVIVVVGVDYLYQHPMALFHVANLG
jgi:hypothetical protein